jgi:hypothetical protein
LKAKFSIFENEAPVGGSSKSDLEFTKSKKKDSVMISGVFKGHTKGYIISVRTPEESAAAHKNFAKYTKAGTGLAFVLRPYTVLRDYQTSLRKFNS